jgi:uncharacterized delta-60 repeat protein
VLGNGRPRRAVALFAVALAVVLTQSAGAAPGDLDPSFGGDGRVALPAAGAFVPRAVAIDRHGRIVIAGYLCEPRPGGDGTCLSEGDSSFRLARLTPDGGLDPEFGVNGFVTTPLGDGRSQALDVVVDAKGRLVAAGVARRGGRDVFALARYLPDGSLDQSFGAGGTALVAAGSAFASLGDVERGPRGTLLATGQAVDADGRGRMVIARFTNAGALDGLFGTGGLTFAPSAFGYGLGLAVTRAGRPLAAGVSGDSEEPRTFRFGIQRTTPAGAPDAAFAGDGFLEVGVGRSSSFANAAVPVPGGGALAAGAGTVAGGHQAMAALRTTPDGRVDLAFGSGGGTLVALGDGAVANDLVLDQAQRALLIGQSAHGAGYRFAVVRLGRDGRREAGFAATGISWRDYPVARATAGALQGRDRLVTVGLGCSGGATANCRGGTPVLLVARIEVGPPEPIRIGRLPRKVTRRRLRGGLLVHYRLVHRGVPESWLFGRRRGSGRRVTLAYGHAPRAGTRFTWRLRVRRRALMHTPNGRLRVVIRAGRARTSRTIRLTG